ncbi:MAG: hypothetical protein HFI38_11080 [Lachnospiraceae bacterium]|nr:hypothetical protein [Lachnospiraceae bacterium]
MKEQITLLASGRQADRPLQLLVEPEEIRMSLAVGENFRGEFGLKEAEKQPVKGLLYSSHRRVHLFTDQFAAPLVTVRYEVDVSGLRPGDRIEGSFFLVTNGGERSLPFAFEMTVPVGKTAFEKIRTIEAFADLARQEFDVALMIFENSSFLTLPFMGQPAFAALYHGLYGRGDRRGALEEFLTGCGAKKQLRLTVDEKRRIVADPKEDQCDVIRIERNTWGAVTATVTADAPFIEPESRLITEASFEDGCCNLHYMVHPCLLHRGTNYGRITITTAYQSFAVEVVVTQSEGIEDRRRRREYRASWQRFFRYYVEVRAKDFRSNMLVNSMLTELSRLRDSYATPDILELFHAEVYLMAGQREKAGLLLEDVRERVLERRREEIDQYCYYYYLRTLYSESEEEKDQLIKILRFYYEGERPSQTIYFLLLLTDPQHRDNPLGALEEMKKLYDRGCRSPFLYLAACRLYSGQPLLLVHTGDFELQALLFGARKGMIGRDLAIRIALLSEEEQLYRPGFYRLLTMLAERYENTELVAAVCRVLILGNRREPEYFAWYEMGVGLDVRLTRLYEYYLYSLPRDRQGELPQEIYLYFSYTNTLDDKSRAVLYDNVLTHFEPGSQVYESYARQMEDFAREQIFAGHMSRQLATVYEKMIPAGMLDEKLAAALPKLLHCFRITCENPGWERVVLSFEEWGREETVALKNGQAVAALYSDSCRILFEDASGNRYAGGSYSLFRLMDVPELEERCLELCPDNPYLLIHRCRLMLGENRSDEEAMAFYERVLAQTSLRELFCRQLTSRMIAGTLACGRAEISGEEAESGEEGGRADFFTGRGSRLLRLNDRYADREDALRMTEVFIEENFCDRAMAMVERYGYEELKPSLLLKLCSRACVEHLFAKNAFLLKACYACMEQRRSDDVILEYLCRYYNSSSERMLKVLLKARQYHTELHDLPERLMAQMLFSGWREGLDEVFAAYEAAGNMDDMLLRAYLVRKCYDFFVSDVAADQQVFDNVKQILVRSWLPFICRIALCRYLSFHRERTDTERQLCMDVIRDCCEKNLLFDFFGAFAEDEEYPAALKGRTVISFRAGKDEMFRIRYQILPDGQESVTERLPHIYEGYFGKCFTVFYGERIEYEIYKERPEGLTKVSEGKVLPEGGTGGRDRLGRLNYLLYGLDTMDEAELRSEMREYSVAEAVTGHYFEKI